MTSVCQNVRLERELLIYKIHQTHPLWGFTALFVALVFLRSFDGFLQFWIQAMTHLRIPLVLSFRYLFRFYLLRFSNIVPVLYAAPRLVKYFVQLMIRNRPPLCFLRIILVRTFLSNVFGLLSVVCLRPTFHIQSMTRVLHLICRCEAPVYAGALQNYKVRIELFICELNLPPNFLRVGKIFHRFSS